MQQLLWFETLLKLAGGVALLIAPATVTKILGLPSAASGFWPRLLGATLLGLSAATFLEGTVPGARGLGLAGCVAINLATAGILAAIAILDGAAETRRGTAVLWLLVALLVILSLFELASA